MAAFQLKGHLCQMEDQDVDDGYYKYHHHMLSSSLAEQVL